MHSLNPPPLNRLNLINAASIEIAHQMFAAGGGIPVSSYNPMAAYGLGAAGQNPFAPPSSSSSGSVNQASAHPTFISLNTLEESQVLIL